MRKKEILLIYAFLTYLDSFEVQQRFNFSNQRLKNCIISIIGILKKFNDSGVILSKLNFYYHQVSICDLTKEKKNKEKKYKINKNELNKNITDDMKRKR